MWLDAVVHQCDNAGGEIVVVVNAKRQVQRSESCHSRGGDNQREKKAHSLVPVCRHPHGVAGCCGTSLW